MTAKHAFVVAHKTLYPISLLCCILGIGRSWFYGSTQSQPARNQRQKLRDDRDADLLAKIKAAFSRSKKRYGSKRIHRDLIADGIHVSERRVARIMRENRVSPRLHKRRKPRTTDSNHSLKPSPNLLEQQFNCTVPNRVWLDPSRDIRDANALSGSGHYLRRYERRMALRCRHQGHGHA
ncbi:MULTISPECIES: IS3 family transposase [unclassified Leisingera]|uniref:IS3 family transposase n=1 Tax=unclassified Leisingera TaxID=2614906 RepID=UPI0009E408CE|nr:MULTISPECIES: IS3 family transposase [unclassified Leisingera]